MIFIITYIDIMNLKQPLQELFHLDADNFIVCTGTNYKSIIKRGPKSAQALEQFNKIINTLGELSAISQGLKQIITNMTKFSGTTQRIYVKIKGSEAVGFVKVGEKNLFYRDVTGNVKELKPTCVLDIYVHQSCQRTGYGKEIFQKFLRNESVTPQKLAYDRPSPKLISFLKKYYNLVEYVPQNNNYVIFNKYFITESNGKTMVNQYFFPNQRPSQITRDKQNNISLDTNQKISKTEIDGDSNKKSDKQIRRESQKMTPIIDSLQALKIQVERSKQRNLTLPPSVNMNMNPQQSSSSSETQHQSSSYKHLQNYHEQRRSSANKNNNYNINININNSNSTNDINGNGNKGSQLSSFDKKLRDLSYRIPWATQNNDNTKKLGINLGFRTTSNAYGNYYNRP